MEKKIALFKSEIKKPKRNKPSPYLPYPFPIWEEIDLRNSFVDVIKPFRISYLKNQNMRSPITHSYHKVLPIFSYIITRYVTLNFRTQIPNSFPEVLPLRPSGRGEVFEG